MGKNIYLTDKEISQLIYACKTYTMWSYEDDMYRELVEFDLNNELGSALRKLSKGTIYEHIYKKYK